MIEIAAKGYDSWRYTVLCDWCQGPIHPMDPKVLYGTGNSLLNVFHPACDVDRVQHCHDSSGEGPLEEKLSLEP